MMNNPFLPLRFPWVLALQSHNFKMLTRQLIRTLPSPKSLTDTRVRILGSVKDHLQYYSSGFLTMVTV